MSAIDDVRSGLVASNIPNALIDEVLKAFVEAKRRFYASDLRPNMIEGGRFSEAVFRILEWQSSGGQYTPIGTRLPSVDKLLVRLQNASGQSDSVRLHIPRTLRLIYDVRNKRDVAHLADGIDPNLQDATLVVRNMEWILAELVRIYHKISATDAQLLIEKLVTRDLPVIQEVDGLPRILKMLTASEYCLVLLYWRGEAGATVEELTKWVRPSMRSNLRRTLRSLDDRNLVHLDGSKAQILRSGERKVENSGYLDPG